jgi:hypothetical protein
MAQVTVQGGARWDLPTAAEISDVMDQRLAAFSQVQQQVADARDREHARTIKPMSAAVTVSAAAQTRYTSLDAVGPSQGYIWAIQIIACQLASAGTLQAFITTDTDTTKTAATQRRLVVNGSTSSAYQVATFGKSACLLAADEGLFLNASQNIISYYLAGWEVAAERAWVLL